MRKTKNTPVPQPRVSDAEFAVQYRAAVKRGAEERAAGHYAEAAWYDPTIERLMLTLTNGVLVGIPVREIRYLAKATPAQLKAVELTPVGSGVSWPALDVDLSVPGLLTDAFGRSALLQGLAHLGGKAKSEAKTAAARANGAKGGRPKKRAA